MKRVLRLLFNRWVLTGIGLLAIALVIWWLGPAIAIHDVYPLEAEWVRWVHILLVVLMPVSRLAWKAYKARRNNTALMDGLLDAGPAPAPAEARPDPSAAETNQLRLRFEEALGLLRRLRHGTDTPSLWTRIRSLGGQQYLYDLPWYVFIGAPGAGKTTALVNCGLRFPLMERLGQEAVQGVGGTRNCDWWFADEAVFLDTAGRYTTQESDRAVDAAAWKAFLQLLKRSRPRRPLNGVLLTVSVGDLLQQPVAERQAHAQILRSRVRELYDELGVRLPVYVILTKTDLLAGFTEFFATLGKDERGQAWGITTPPGEQGVERGALAAELLRLERRLYERLPERLEEERDPIRRALVYGFPQQLGLLRERLVAFMDVAFSASKLEPAPRLRGVYFTSGTQEGTPIDRVMGALSRELGLGRRMLPAQHPTGRSYFLTRLLRDVIFPEAGLAGIDLRWEQRRQRLHRAALAGAAITVIAFTAGWWISYQRNAAYIDEVTARFADVKAQVALVRAGAKSDVSLLLSTLGGVRTLTETRATSDGAVPWSWRLGLYQGGKLEAARRASYQRMLEDTFLPSLAAYVERYLREEASASQDESYETLKTYLMLYDPKRFDRDAVWQWFATRGAELAGTKGADGVSALKTHFDALYQRGWVEPSIARNDAVIGRVRASLGRESLPARIYAKLKRLPELDVPDFTIAEKGGPTALLALERVSREPITKGVPGLFTRDGYYKHVTGRIDLLAAQHSQEDDWVHGTGRRASAVVSIPQIGDAVRRLYLEDYRRTWRAFVNDITVVRDRDLTRTIEVTRLLSSPESPLKPLMRAIDRETTLSAPPEGGLPGAAKAQEYASKARKALTGGGAVPIEKTLVDDHFADLRRFVTSPGGNAPAPIDAVTLQLNDLYQLLVATKAALDAAQTLPPAEAANKLRADASRQPEPLRSMLQDLVEGGTRQVVDKLREKQVAELRLTRDRIDAELRAQVGDFCQRAIAGRYPFVRTSNQDVTAEDFARLFAPSALLDSFFQKHVAPHVDTTQKPWRFKDPAMGQSPALAEFQRAQVIRDVFFRSGGSTPSLQLDFKPVEMDAAIQLFMLDVDGKLVRYAHGPQVPVRVQFPGPGGRSQVRISISPAPPSGSAGAKFEGPWALFRMLDGVQIEETKQSERVVATFSIEGRRAVFEMIASSVRNPFRLTELAQFRCPTQL
jgi:type VI secretion system protein ImpL